MVHMALLQACILPCLLTVLWVLMVHLMVHPMGLWDPIVHHHLLWTVWILGKENLLFFSNFVTFKVAFNIYILT